jgi:integrase/recombinase XerD
MDRLLIQYVQQQLLKAPSQMTLPNLNTAFLGAFRDHHEQKRANSDRSRNARLAAIHSFFFATLHCMHRNTAQWRNAFTPCPANATYADPYALPGIDG